MLGLKYQKCQEVRKECSGICEGPVATADRVTGQNSERRLEGSEDYRSYTGALLTMVNSSVK